MPRLHTGTGETPTHVTSARATARRECDESIATLTSDTARLRAEITWLCRSFKETRLRAANLEAAIRAALHAQEDGDYDPIGYLRDEITPDTGGAYGA
jgi:hypothetical protein